MYIGAPVELDKQIKHVGLENRVERPSGKGYQRSLSFYNISMHMCYF